MSDLRYDEIGYWSEVKLDILRDIISHHYFDLNADVVFTICKDRIPGLIQTITKIKDTL